MRISDWSSDVCSSDLVSDDKAMAAVFTDNLVRYRSEGYVPRRSIKLALTCGEETSEIFNSVDWLLRHHPQALDAAFALNEGAGGELDGNGKTGALPVPAGEKVYPDFSSAERRGGTRSCSTCKLRWWPE